MHSLAVDLDVVRTYPPHRISSLTRAQLDEILTWVSEHRSRLEIHLIREPLYVRAANRLIADEFEGMLATDVSH